MLRLRVDCAIANAFAAANMATYAPLLFPDVLSIIDARLSKPCDAEPRMEPIASVCALASSTAIFLLAFAACS